MLISTFEYHALFGDKPKEKISNEDMVKEVNCPCMMIVVFVPGNSLKLYLMNMEILK